MMQMARKGTALVLIGVVWMVVTLIPQQDKTFGLFWNHIVWIFDSPLVVLYLRTTHCVSMESL